MKVKELIKILEKYDPEYTVDTDMINENILYVYGEAKITERRCIHCVCKKINCCVCGKKK